MNLPIHTHEGWIYDADGVQLACCANPEIATLICERVNTWQKQYALGYNAGTTVTNAKRDHEQAVQQSRKRR